MQNTLFFRGRSSVNGAMAHGAPGGDGGPGFDLRSKAQEAASLLKALANPDRLLLLCQMVEAERSVAELGALTDIGQPSLSQQLAVLRGEQLVATRRDGKHVLYRVQSSAALAVLQTLCGLFGGPVPASPAAAGRPAAAQRVRRGVA